MHYTKYAVICANFKTDAWRYIFILALQEAAQNMRRGQKEICVKKFKIKKKLFMNRKEISLDHCG